MWLVCSTGPGAEPQVFVGRTQGRIVPARGPSSFGWDPIFEPEGYQDTYAQMDKAVKNTISHRCGSRIWRRQIMLVSSACRGFA